MLFSVGAVNYGVLRFGAGEGGQGFSDSVCFTQNEFMSAGLVLDLFMSRGLVLDLFMSMD